MIGDSIKTHRNERKISQRALAKASGVSFAYIQQLEKGLKKNPSLDILNKIADALDITLDELLNDESTSFSSILIAAILRMDYVKVDFPLDTEFANVREFIENGGNPEDYSFEIIRSHTEISINSLKKCIEENKELEIDEQLKLIDFWYDKRWEDDGIELEEFYHQNINRINKNPIISSKIKTLLYDGVTKNDTEKLVDLLEKYNFKINISSKNDESILSIYNNENPIITESESKLLPAYNEIMNKINSYAKFIIEDELRKLKKD